METALKNKIEKVVINCGIGRLATNTNNFEEKVLPDLIKELSLIAAQKPAARSAKKSIAGFKLRMGNVVGLKATLRGKRMEQFLGRLIKVVLPRVRDFRGIDLKNVDGSGNLNIGIKEHLVFPEINPEESRVNFGLQITIVPNVKSREEAIELYRKLGVPLKKV